MEHFSEESADLLEIGCAEFLFHSGHHGLEKMTEESQSNQWQVSLKSQQLCSILNQDLIKAIKNGLKELLKTGILRTICGDDSEN